MGVEDIYLWELRKNKSLAAIESDYSKNKTEIKVEINR